MLTRKLIFPWFLPLCLLAKIASSQFVCYEEDDCAEGNSEAFFSLANSFHMCCRKPYVISVRDNINQSCIPCGPPTTERVTPRISPFYPPQALVLEVEVTGYSGITWLLNGTTAHDFSRITLEDNNKKYTLSPTTSSDVGTYEARIFTLDESITTLDFIVSPYVAPDIAFLAVSEDDIVDDLVNVTCLVQSNPVSSVIVECQNLQPLQTIVSVDEGEFGSIPVVMATVSVPTSGATGQQKCFCNATVYDGEENVTESNFTYLLPSPPQIIFQASDGMEMDVTVLSSLSVSLKCVAKGRPTPEISWYRNGIEITPSNIISIDSNSENFVVNSSLTIAQTVFEDSGDYICEATNIYGNTSVILTLNVQASPFTVAPVSMLEVNTNTMTEVSLVCESTGNPQPSIFWFTANGPLDNCIRMEEIIGEAEIDFSAYFPSSSESGTSSMGDGEDGNVETIDSCSIESMTLTSASGLSVTNSTLTIQNLYQEDSIFVVCVADNGLANTNSPNEAASIHLILDKSPYITLYPTPIVGLTEGKRVLFSCAAISHLPVSALWLKDEENITDASALTISSGTELGSEYFTYESTLTLDPTRETDSGLYTCLMQNSGGTAQFSFQQNVEPLISITTMLQTQEVSKGNNVSINCSASGPNNLTITWKTSGMPIVPLDGNITITTLDLISNGSSVSSTLTILAVDLQDQGSYDCVVSSQFQSDEKTVATVTVVVPPEVSINATNLVHVIGEEATVVTCSANLYPPPTPDVTFHVFTCDYTALGEGSEDFPVVDGVSAECGLQEELADGTVIVHVTLFIDITEPGQLLLNCSADNGVSPVAEKSVPLVIATPLTINTIAKQTVYIQHRGSYSISCNVSGASDVAIEWYHSNSSTPISPGPRAVISTKSGEDSVLGTLLLINADSNDEGGYVCMATDPLTGYSVQKTIVYLLIAVPLEVTVHPAAGAEFHNGGALVQLTCNVTGEPTPTVTFAGLTCGETESGGGMQVECLEEDLSNGVLVSATLTVTSYASLGPHVFNCTADNGVEGPVTQSVPLTVYSAPVINTQHQTEVVTDGDSLNISCNASGYPIPTLHFVKDEGPIIVGDYSVMDNDTFTVMSTLVIDSIIPNYTGEYLCFASTPNMSHATKSILDVTVQFSPIVSVSASIVIHITEQGVTSVTCTATAVPSPIVFFHNFTCTEDLIGEGEEEVLLLDGVTAECVTADDGSSVLSVTLLIDKEQTGEFLFNCSAENDIGMADAEPVLLIVAEPIEITAGLQNTSELFGSNVTLTCQTKGYPPPNITWVHEDSMTDLTSQSSLVSDGLSQLQLVGISLTDNGLYTCIADNGITPSTSSSAYLTVEGMMPLLDIDFEQQEIVLGSPFNVNCTAVGIPPPTIEWSKDGTPIASNGSNISITATAQVTDVGQMAVTSTLTITAAKIKDAGSYSCSATNDFGAQAQTVAELVIHVPPVVAVSPVATSHVIGGPPTQLTCIAISNPPPTVQFGPTQPCSYEENNAPGPLSVPAISRTCNSASDLGIYIVTVTLLVGDVNKVGEYRLNCTASTDVFPPAANHTTLNITVKPAISITASGNFLDEGDSVTLHCEAMGYPLPTITWLWNNKALNHTNTDDRRTIESQPVEKVYEVRSKLTIANLVPDDSGEYRCRLDGTFLDGQLLTAEQNINVQAKNDCLIVVNDNVHSTPCVYGLCHDELGGFTCFCFTNYTGDTCNETVEVIPPPEIFVSPPDITETNLLGNVNLTCVASGNPTYKWSRDGEPYTETKNPILTIADVQPDDRGRYSCLAVNEVGSVDSTPGLVVIPGVFQYIATFQVENSSLDSTTIIDQIAVCIAGRSLETVNTQIYSASPCNADQCTESSGHLDVIITVVKEPPNEDDPTGITSALADALEEDCLPVAFTGKLRRYDGCPEETVQLNQDLSINITWAEANLGENVRMFCPCGDLTSSQFLSNNATRYCNGSFSTGGHWEEQNVTQCQYNAQDINITLQLCYMTTVNNVETQVSLLADATTEANAYSSFDLTIASLLMEEIATSQEIKKTKTIQVDYMQSFNNLLGGSSEKIRESQELGGSAARILESLSHFEGSVHIDEEGDESLVMFEEDSVAVLLLETNITQFTNQTFIAMVEEDIGTVISLRLRNSFSVANSSQFEFSISIPETLPVDAPELTDPVRLSYNIFTTAKLFQNDPNSKFAGNISDGNLTVGDIVISASVPTAGKVDGLIRNNITITFTKPQMVRADGTNLSRSTCVFWDVSDTSSAGVFDSWSDRGCTLVSDEEEDVIRCECSHLTSFGYLLAIDPKPKDDLALEVFLYVGCIVSIVCLVITFLTYAGSRTLRSTIKGKVILHTCLALIGLYTTFLVAHHSKSIREAEGIDGDILCAFVGALLYYFMLVYFMWTAMEAFDIHQKLVKVFVQPYKHYILVSAIIAWGVPFVISCISAGAGYKDYLEYEFFCRPANLPFYVGFLVPFGLVYIFNAVIFVKILFSLLRSRGKTTKIQSSRASHYAEMKKYCVIAFLLSINFGFGWIFGLLAVPELPDELYYAFLILFSIFVGSQGVLIFILHCLRVTAARQTWQRWALIVLCCRAPADARRSVKTGAAFSSLPFKFKKKKKSDPHPVSSGHTKSLSFDPLQSDTDGTSTLPPDPLYDERVTMDTYVHPPSLYDDEGESKFGVEEEKVNLTQSETDVTRKRSKSGGLKKKKKKRPSSHRLSDQEIRVESMYSLGAMSTESQALEIQFKPETDESESEDEKELWEKLQQQMRDITAIVSDDFKEEVDGTV